MAEKKQQTTAPKQLDLDVQPTLTTPPISECMKSAEKFNKAVFDLGLTLIEDYKAGRCRDANKTLEAVIEIFKSQMYLAPNAF